MNLSIVFISGNEIHLKYVEYVKLVHAHRVEVKCFGNEPVIHKDVWEVRLDYSVDRLKQGVEVP